MVNICGQDKKQKVISPCIIICPKISPLLIQWQAFQPCPVGPLPYCSGNSSSDLLSLQRTPPPWKDCYSDYWQHQQEQPCETGLLPSTRPSAERWQRRGGTVFQGDKPTGRRQAQTFCKRPIFVLTVIELLLILISTYLFTSDHGSSCTALSDDWEQCWRLSTLPEFLGKPKRNQAAIWCPFGECQKCNKTDWGKYFWLVVPFFLEGLFFYSIYSKQESFFLGFFKILYVWLL